jgi:hypothetical protein
VSAILIFLAGVAAGVLALILLALMWAPHAPWSRDDEGSV